ncbi:ATP-binding protein [Pseudoalteromonas rubra]|uniref:ATP-binding protein n=1 Tax=Pseudoalteromonas rubra TaxID=43658 RepID=UPI002DB8E8E2|nr:ATP-binding protein [Pseudoalteromonas rubra]MEC4088141.1 ATP-binding protein [Pseudoalteromonas rubra]
MTRLFFIGVVVLFLTGGVGFAGASPEHEYTALFEKGLRHFKKLDTKKWPLWGVYQIAQDERGLIWFATDMGIYRYDGHTFKPFNLDVDDQTSIASNLVNGFWMDSQSRLWLSHTSEGISIFNTLTESAVRINALNAPPNGLTGNGMVAIEGNNQGTVAVSSTSGLDLIFEDSQGFNVQAVTLQGECGAEFSTQYIHTLHWQNAQTLWVGGDFGLCELAIPGRAKVYQARQITALADLPVRSLTSGNGMVWVGTASAGMYRLNTAEDTLTQISDSVSETPVDVEDWLQVSDQEIWAVALRVGILVIDAQSLQVKSIIHTEAGFAHALASTNPKSLFRDAAGVIWISTWGDGVFTLDPVHTAIRRLVAGSSLSKTFNTNNIRAIAALNKAYLAFGTVGAGITLYSWLDNDFAPLKTGTELDAATVFTIRTGPDGQLWAATNVGVFVIEPATQKATKMPWQFAGSAVRRMAFSTDEAFLSTSDHLFRVSLDDFSIEKIETIGNEAASYKTFSNVLLTDSEGNLWIASRAGLYVLRKGAQALLAVNEEAQTASGISKAATFGVAFHPNGQLIVTNELLQGFYYLDTQTWPVQAEQLPSERADVRAGANIWVDQRQRIWNDSSIYYPELSRWDNINSALGIYALCYGEGGHLVDQTLLLIGCPDGVIMFDTQQWQPWMFRPNIAITSAEVNGEARIISDTQLDLPPASKNFTIQFSALDYKNTEELKYMHQLRGFDEQWQDTKERRVTYTNLPPGEYQLLVKSTNAVGNWGEEKTLLQVRQLPAWYQTHAFYFGGVLLLLLGIWGIVRFRVRRLQQQTHLLNRLVKDKTRRLEQLAEIGKELTTSLDLDEVMDMMHEKVTSLLHCDVFLIAVVDHEQDELHVAGCFEDGVRQASFSYPLDDLSRPACWCVTHKKEICVSSQDALQALLGQSLKPPVFGSPTESIIYIPLWLQDDVIGCISVQSHRKKAFRSVDLQTLATIASYAAVAIENAQAHADLINAQERLIESEKLASLTHVVTGVAHEINTPLGIALTAITGLGAGANSILQKLAENKIRKCDISDFAQLSLETESLTQSSLERCSRLVQDFKKLSAEQSVSEPREIQLKTYLQELMQAFEFTLAQNSIAIEVFGDDPKLMTDPGVISQIIGCLINNVVAHAFEYQPDMPAAQDKRVDIQVSAQKNQATIMFKDNGVGIDENIQKQIFIPFYTTKRGSGNTGLGLNVVYNLTKSALGGELTVESEDNMGTAFLITIPMRQASG